MALLAFAIAVNGSSTVYISVKCDSSSNPAAATTSKGPSISLYQGDFRYPYE